MRGRRPASIQSEGRAGIHSFVTIIGNTENAGGCCFFFSLLASSPSGGCRLIGDVGMINRGSGAGPARGEPVTLFQEISLSIADGW